MCDPVVYVKLGTQQKNTRIIEKTQEPIWNETFSLGIKNMEAQHLEIEVYDCSSVYGLSFLGCVHIPLRRMLQDSKPNISVGAKKASSRLRCSSPHRYLAGALFCQSILVPHRMAMLARHRPVFIRHIFLKILYPHTNCKTAFEAAKFHPG